MSEAPAAWPRPSFKATAQPTKLCFLSFGRAPLEELPLSRARYGLPSDELVAACDLREHRRATDREWFEGWWQGPFGVIAERDLGAELAQLTSADVCYSVTLELPDRADLSPVQTCWGIARWLCDRGARVVLDVHAFRFRTAAELAELDFAGGDVERDVKVVLENQPTRGGLHLMHTRGLCKFARPELSCFLEANDAEAMGRAMYGLARALMDGATADQLRLGLGSERGVELVAADDVDEQLIQSLGLEAAVSLRRSDGAALAGVAELLR